MPYVTIRQGEKELGWRELDNSLTIGRHRECEVCIVDSRLSRTHCRFEPDGDDWAAVDLGSRNGTWCDGVSVDRVLLIEGDAVYAGRCTFTFHAGEPPATGRYQSRTSARPADPHEALEGTIVGVTVVERPRDPWMAMSSRIRPRPMPHDVDLEPRPRGTGLLDLDLDIEPETRTITNLPRTRFLPRPIKLELPTVEELQTEGDDSRPLTADSPVAVCEVPKTAPAPAVARSKSQRRFSLDFWLFALLVVALVASAITLFLSLPVLAADAPPTQDLLGILHGKMAVVDKPIQEQDRPALGSVRAICVTPDAKKAVVHEWMRLAGQPSDRVVVVDVATGKIEHVLDEYQNGQLSSRYVRIGSDGKSVILVRNRESILAEFELATGKVLRKFDLVDNKDVDIDRFRYSGDGRMLAAATEDSGAVVWDLQTGKGTFVKLKFIPAEARFAVYPLSGRDDLLVLVGAKSKDDEIKMQVVLFEPKSGKTSKLTELQGNCDLLLTADGKQVYLFRQENPQMVVWTAIEQWDLGAAKMTRKMALKPPLASIGLKLTQDGNTLFLHEYMAQPVVVWNLRLGKLEAVVCPERWGCEAFDITPDGKKVVAIVGPWVQGTLSPKKLAVYDTSAFVAADAKP